MECKLEPKLEPLHLAFPWVGECGTTLTSELISIRNFCPEVRLVMLNRRLYAQPATLVTPTCWFGRFTAWYMEVCIFEQNCQNVCGTSIPQTAMENMIRVMFSSCFCFCYCLCTVQLVTRIAERFVSLSLPLRPYVFQTQWSSSEITSITL